MQPRGLAGVPSLADSGKSASGACANVAPNVVVVLLGNSSSPPNPTAKTTAAALPNRASTFVISGFIRFSVLHRVIGLPGRSCDKEPHQVGGLEPLPAGQQVLMPRTYRSTVAIARVLDRNHVAAPKPGSRFKVRYWQGCWSPAAVGKAHRA
jgi:hypothetical protein